MEQSASSLAKKETFFEKIKYSLLIFVILLIRTLATSVLKTKPVELLYLIDTYLGFRSKTFIGTVIGLFTKNPTREIFSCIFIVTFIVNLLLISLLLGWALKKCNNNTLAVIIIAVLVGSRLTQGYYDYSYLLDIYWMTAAVLSVFCLKNKYARWLIPFITFLGFWIHFAYCVGYMLMIVAMIVYDTFKKKPGKIDIAWFVFCAVGMAGGLLYFLVIGENLEPHTQSQVLSYLSEKFKQTIENDVYLDYNFFKSYQGTRLESNGVLGILKWMFVGGYVLENAAPARLYVIEMIVLLIILSGFFAVISKLFKNQKEKNLRFICLVIFLTIIGNIFAVAISTDTSRWLAYGLICQGGILLHIMSDRENPFKDELEKVGDFAKKNLCFIVSIILLCSAVMRYVG